MDFEQKRISAYFSHLTSTIGVPKARPQAVVVAHMVSNSVHFLPALNEIAEIVLLLPKPSARNSPESKIIEGQGYKFGDLSRGWSNDPKPLMAQLANSLDGTRDFLIVDIGGYFAPALSLIRGNYDQKFLGIMEGTENGVQKYEELEELAAPVVTVARSPLKLPEDYLVGASIVYSVEAVLRSQSQILQTRTACVIGYGRVGSGVAEVLRGRGIATVVHDTSPIAIAEAAARGFQVFRRIDDALRQSTLVVSATGMHALDARALAAMKNGTLVATVTSGDDEFSKDQPLRLLKRSRVSERDGDSVVRYDSDSGKYIWLVNDGKAANFAHGAVIGPAMQLIEGEKLMAVSRLIERAFKDYSSGPKELGFRDRTTVASVWNEHFIDE